MGDRYKVLTKVFATQYTHRCPECNQGAFCVMEAGKSASLCWCMTVQAKPSDQVKGYDVCLCKNCLQGE